MVDEVADVVVEVVVEEVTVQEINSEGAPGPRGPQGFDAWSPIFAAVPIGNKVLLQLVDYVGGDGDKPEGAGLYLGPSGLVSDPAVAADVRGLMGPSGPKGDAGQDGKILVGEGSGILTGSGDPSDALGNPGDLYIDDQNSNVWAKSAANEDDPNGTWDLQLNIKGQKGDKGDQGEKGADGTIGVNGLSGWSPILALVADGSRRVLRVIDWTGSTGTKPATGLYIGSTGLVADIAQAMDVRGSAGVAGPQGDPGAAGRSLLFGNGDPASLLGSNGDSYVDRTDPALTLWSKALGVWTKGTATLKGEKGDPGEPGAAGTPGAKGDKGDTGDASTVPGPEGPPGSKGDKGDQGDPGADSTVPGPRGFSFLSGTGVPSNGLGIDGDTYTNSLNGDVYGPKTGGVWGTIKGSLRGLQGQTGLQGTPGTPGSPGLRGSVWFFGAGDPGVIGGSIALDVYVDTDDGDVFQYTGSAWAFANFNIKGVQGDPGADGAQGTPGTPGSTGPRGASLLSGAGAPSNALGLQGDSYINSTNGDVYGPKGASAWGAVTGNIRGPQGATGNDGAPGTAGAAGVQVYSGTGAPSNALGIVNDWYVATDTQNWYKKTGTSTWTLQFNSKGTNGVDAIGASDFNMFFPGKVQTAGQLMFRAVVVRAFTWPTALANSSFTSNIASTALTAFSVNKNGVYAGAIRFLAGASTAASIIGPFATAPTAWAVNDVMTISHSSASVDATLSDVSFNMWGSR